LRSFLLEQGKTMRKLFWCAAATAVIGAAAVYVTTGYVRDHPDSLLAGCVSAAWRVGMAASPLGHLAGEVADRDCVNMQDGQPDFDWLPEEPCPERLQPVPSGEDCEACEPLLPQTAPPQVIESPEGIVPLTPLTVEPLGPAGEETFRPMPPCCQEAPQSTEPPTTPCPGGTGLMPGVSEFWKLFVPGGTCPGTTETCDDVQGGRPPACKEDCRGTDHYPACPQMGSCCPHSGKQTPTGAAEECTVPEPIPAPHKVTEAAPESGCCPAGEDCPACPHGATCCPHACPCCPAGAGCEKAKSKAGTAVEPEPIPMPRKVPGEPKAATKSTSRKVAPVEAVPGLLGPGIDTLEFRPSDAKKGEFDPIWY
jgi:hypothetical protein